jgi:hypothetical protein
MCELKQLRFLPALLLLALALLLLALCFGELLWGSGLAREGLDNRLHTITWTLHTGVMFS